MNIAYEPFRKKIIANPNMWYRQDSLLPAPDSDPQAHIERDALITTSENFGTSGPAPLFLVVEKVQLLT